MKRKKTGANQGSRVIKLDIVKVMAVVPEPVASPEIVMVSLLLVKQTPPALKHPPVKTMPLAKVDETEVEVIFKADALTPALKVLVVLPKTVIMVEETYAK